MSSKLITSSVLLLFIIVIVICCVSGDKSTSSNTFVQGVYQDELPTQEKESLDQLHRDNDLQDNLISYRSKRSSDHHHLTGSHLSHLGSKRGQHSLLPHKGGGGRHNNNHHNNNHHRHHLRLKRLAHNNNYNNNNKSHHRREQESLFPFRPIQHSRLHHQQHHHHHHLRLKRSVAPPSNNKIQQLAVPSLSPGMPVPTQMMQQKPMTTGDAKLGVSKKEAMVNNKLKDDDDNEEDDEDDDDDDDDDDDGDHLSNRKRESKARGLFDFNTEFPTDGGKAEKVVQKRKKKLPSTATGSGGIKDLHGANVNERIQSLRESRFNAFGGQNPFFTSRPPPLQSSSNQHIKQQARQPPPPLASSPFKNPFFATKKQQQEQQVESTTSSQQQHQQQALSKKPVKKINIYKALLGSISVISILGVIGDLSNSFSQSRGQDMIRGFVTKLVETMVEFMVQMFSGNGLLASGIAPGASKFLSDMFSGSLAQAIEKPILDSLT